MPGPLMRPFMHAYKFRIAIGQPNRKIRMTFSPFSFPMDAPGGLRYKFPYFVPSTNLFHAWHTLVLILGLISAIARCTMFRLTNHGRFNRAGCISRKYLTRVLGLILPAICIITLWRFSSNLSAPYQRTSPIDSDSLPGNNITNPSTLKSDNFKLPGPTDEAVQFWDDLVETLSTTEPQGDEIKAPEPLQRGDFDPRGAGPKLHVDVLDLPKKQLLSLKQTHKDYVQKIRNLAPKLPFKKNTRGIVITSKGELFGIAVTAILMIRRVGSKLPIQLFLDSADKRQQQTCNDSLGALDVQCFNFDDFLQVSESSQRKTPKLERFQFKVFSLIFSSFQDILFLDADAFPVKNPDHLFDVEPYKSHGLVTWPDFWVPTISPLFYEIAEAEMPNVTITSRASESGVILYNKAEHAESLLLAAYYNFYGKYYFQLQSQGAWGSGDKETFMQSALALGKPHWQVKTDAEFLTADEVHDGSAIWQADPEYDWNIQNKISKSQRKLEEGDQSVLLPETSAMFAHLNRVKIDTRHLGQLVADPVIKTKDKKLSRIWGPDVDRISKVAGYDLEKVIWEEVIKATCDHSLLEECEVIHNYYDEVFANHD